MRGREQVTLVRRWTIRRRFSCTATTPVRSSIRGPSWTIRRSPAPARIRSMVTASTMRTPRSFTTATRRPILSSRQASRSHCSPPGLLHPLAPPGIVPIGQFSLFAYFRDRASGKTFALLLGIFDNRFASNPAYVPFVAHDGATPFVSTPIGANARYATMPPVSSAFTGTTWTGLRFFRVHVTQDNFRQALTDVNAYCLAHDTQRYCAPSTAAGDAYSPSVTDYQITDFGVIHEIFRNPRSNLSMGVHVFDLGAWNFR